MYLRFLLILFPTFLFAQNTIKVNSFNIDVKENLLLESSKYFEKNELINHQVVDLVDAYTLDSTFTRSFERHRVVGGGIIRLLGYRWKSVDQKRHKFVGWVNRHYIHDVEKEAQFTEYDINYDLIPELDEYKELAYQTYQAQYNMKKSKKDEYEGQAPYIKPTKNVDMRKYRFHCENTPAKSFRSALNTFFYPVHRNNELKKHHNFEDPNPVMGMYGVLVLDCNHSCHPEIHPYEWLWWLNLTEKKPTWNVGFIRDVSNRFKHWSSAPRTGEIRVPFAFNLNDDEYVIEVNHQIVGNFNKQGFEQLNLPEQHYFFNQNEQKFNFDIPSLNEKELIVKSKVKLPYKSLAYYFEQINLDAKNNILTGYLVLATSIQEAYTAEIKYYSLNR